jgi:hypothetical protein
MPLSSAQTSLIRDAYRHRPEGVQLYRTQWKTARILEKRLIGFVLHNGTFKLYESTIQLIHLGRAMK